MKYLFLLLALLLVTRLAAAQAPRPAARPDSLSTPLGATSATPDTVAALHRLFAHKRQVRTFVVAGTTMAVLAGASVLASQSPNSILTQSDHVKLAGLGVGLIGGPVVAIEFLAYGSFSRRNEEKAVINFQTHQLPKYLKRKLKDKYLIDKVL